MLLTDGVNNIKKIFTNCMVLLLQNLKKPFLSFSTLESEIKCECKDSERERMGREDNERLKVETFLQRLWSEEMVWETILMLTDT